MWAQGTHHLYRWSERISILSSLSGHTRLRIAEEFLGSCAVAGLLFIANRRLRVPVHNKLPIRHEQMIVFGLGSVNITFVRRPRFRRLWLRITSAEWIRNSSLLALLNRCIFIRQRLYPHNTEVWTTKTVVSLKAKGVDRKWTNNCWFQVRFRSLTNDSHRFTAKIPQPTNFAKDRHVHNILRSWAAAVMLWLADDKMRF